MRLRLTIVTTLAAGILLSGTGAGLAFQGLGQSDDAGAAQYGSGNQPERFVTEGGVQGQAERGQPFPAPKSSNQPDRVLGFAPPIDVQPARQVEAGSSLPFSGFAAIPILLLGASFLVAGLILYRKAPRGD